MATLRDTHVYRIVYNTAVLMANVSERLLTVITLYNT